MAGPIALPIGPASPTGIFSTGGLLGLFQGLLQQVSADSARLFADVMDRFFLRTESFDPGGGPFTGNHALLRMYGLTSGIARAAVATVIVYIALRAIFERGSHSSYDLKALLPRLMVVTLLVQFGLPLVQAAIDLNNALVTRIALRATGDGPMSGWSAFVRYNPDGNVVLGILVAIAAVMLVIIAVTAVARNLLLMLLAASLPLVAMGVLLPEMRTVLHSWRRLFLTTVFSQVAEVMMMRIAFLLSFGHDSGFVDAIHGLVAFYLVLKMPTALHAASRAESRAMEYARHAEHAISHLLTHASPSRTSRVRAHPAA
jgi:hypothetical protein